MSGPLGVPAIRRTYAPALDEFPARRIALDAFMAGNDLLYLSRFALTEDWEQQLDNYRAVIAFFQERYRADPDFAAEVDDAVRRILQLKLRLYERTPPAAGRALMPPVPLSQLLVQESDLRVLPGAQIDAIAAPAVQATTLPATATIALTATGATTTTSPLTTGAAATVASALGAAAGVSAPAPDTGAVQPVSAAAQTARKALTVLFPDPAGGAPPPTPQAGEKIVIVSDSRLQRECPTCTAEAAIDPDAIARIIVQLYGPEATGQINPADITSLTFSDLAQLLPPEAVTATGTPSLLPTPTPTPLLTEDATPPSTELLEGSDGLPGADSSGQPSSSGIAPGSELAEADWLIFATLDPNNAFAGSTALRRYLRLASDQLAGKRVVVFALNAPSFLDATEISKLTLYLGVYCKAEPFLESAVRALFRSFAPEGAPAVSVPGTRFASLGERVTPDPALSLPLQIRNPAGVLTSNEAAQAANEQTGATLPAENSSEAGPAVVNVGEVVQVQVGPILDRNGNPVPDGTVVTYLADFEGAELALTIPPALTTAGRALREVVLERGGVLRIAAAAGEGSTGDPLILNVLEPLPATVSSDTATGTTAADASAAIEAAETGADGETASSGAEAAPESGASAVLTPTAPLGGLAGVAGVAGVAGERVNLLTLLLSLLTMLVSLSLLLLAQIRVLPRETLFKSLLWAVIAGLAAYLLYAAGWLPGSTMVAGTLNNFGAPLVVFLAMLLPLFWLQLRPGGDR
jgi:beta-N-acetylhexosaminidase